jgi:cytochrome c oxidase subunit 4
MHAEDSHSVKTYYVVYGILMLLLVATVWVAFHNFGQLNIVITLLIAGVKAGLVIWYFMHVKDASPLILFSIITAIVVLIIMFLLLFSDYLTRGYAG